MDRFMCLRFVHAFHVLHTILTLWPASIDRCHSCSNDMMGETIPFPITPPLKFTITEPNLYRGAYPRDVNFSFLKSLNLKTLVSLTPNPITPDTDPNLYKFAKENNIRLIHLECEQSGKGKKRGVPLKYKTVLEALDYMVHSQFQPVYLHCLNGGQVTSLVIACLRKLQFWSTIAIFNEFINFSFNITATDRNFVEGFKGEISINFDDKVSWLWVGMNKEVISSNPRIKVTDIGDKGE